MSEHFDYPKCLCTESDPLPMKNGYCSECNLPRPYETCGYCYAEVKQENLSMHEEWHRDLRGW